MPVDQPLLALHRVDFILLSQQGRPVVTDNPHKGQNRLPMHRHFGWQQISQLPGFCPGLTPGPLQLVQQPGQLFSHFESLSRAGALAIYHKGFNLAGQQNLAGQRMHRIGQRI